MTIYKAGLYTSVFSHVINSIEESYRQKIFYIYAQRMFTDKETTETVLPFLYKRSSIQTRLQFFKRSETSISNPEWREIIKTIRKENFGDLTVNKIGFLTENSDLKENIEKALNKKIAPTKFVILFESNTKSSKEYQIKRKLLNIMKDYAEKLGLKYASLELSGIYTLQDWRSGKKYNLLTTEKMFLEKGVVSRVVKSVFKEYLKLKGTDVKIRFCKQYEMSKGKILKLVGCEDI